MRMKGWSIDIIIHRIYFERRCTALEAELETMRHDAERTEQELTAAKQQLAIANNKAAAHDKVTRNGEALSTSFYRKKPKLFSW